MGFLCGIFRSMVCTAVLVIALTYAIKMLYFGEEFIDSASWEWDENFQRVFWPVFSLTLFILGIALVWYVALFCKKNCCCPPCCSRRDRSRGRTRSRGKHFTLGDEESDTASGGGRDSYDGYDLVDM